jgi:hypothetical protein
MHGDELQSEQRGNWKLPASNQGAPRATRPGATIPRVMPSVRTVQYTNYGNDQII